MILNYVEQVAPSIICRANVEQPVLTGFAVLDAIVPIGRGQRELIIGDRGTGKSYLARSICLNQKRTNRYLSPETLGRDRLFCIYVCIGLRSTEVRRLLFYIRKHGISWYTTIKAATAGHSALKQYNVPFLGCAAAEEFRDLGYNALVIFDSLTNHAIAHRQKSLLLKITPGREAYPADTFYVHAKLLERASQLTKRLGYGSLTALPIIETQANNLAAFIPTNVISITDGQIFLSKDLSNRRVYPAVDIDKSVSRIGSKAQPALIKEVSGLLKRMLQNYNQYSETIRFGYNLSAYDKMLYNKSLCAYSLCQQREPRFFEENVILIIAADLGILCPTKTQITIKTLLVKLYLQPNRWILQLLLTHKYFNKSNNIKISQTKFLLSLLSTSLINLK